MNAPDVNILLYAHKSGDALFERANVYLDAALRGPDPFGIPILSLQGFIRISTSPSFGANRLSLGQACAEVERWLASPNVSILHMRDQHWRIVQDLARAAGVSGADFTDAAIAAIAVEHNAVLHSTDRGFARFPGLRWMNPLA